MSDLSSKAVIRFSEWQKGLVWIHKQHKKASEAEQEAKHSRVRERQKELLKAIGDGCGQLSSYLRRELQIPEDDGFKAPSMPRRLIGDEIREPPFELEFEVGRQWREAISPADASSPLFWVRCYIDWLDQSLIDGNLLAAFTFGGRADHQGQNEDADVKRQEAQTRNFLRRLCGIPVVRFNVSVLSDCTLSRAWWRFRVANITAENCEGIASAEQAHRLLHTSNQAWEELVRLAVRRITAINHPRALAGIVSHFIMHRDFNPNVVKACAQNLARLAYSYSMEHITWKTLQAAVASTGIPNR